MCGILAVLGCADDTQGKRVRVLELSRRLKHRGPDWSGMHQVGDCYLSHQRLAIIDPASGDQPLYNEDKSLVVTVRLLLCVCLCRYCSLLLLKNRLLLAGERRDLQP